MQDSIQSPTVKPIPSSEAGFLLKASIATAAAMQQHQWCNLTPKSGLARSHYAAQPWHDHPATSCMTVVNGTSLFAAWQHLHQISFVCMKIPGYSSKPYTLVTPYPGPKSSEVERYAKVAPNIAEEFAWPANETLEWLKDLHEGAFIDTALYLVLSHKSVLQAPRPAKRQPIDHKLRLAIFNKTNGFCSYCAIPLTFEHDRPNTFECDHVFPVRLGGTNDPGNMIPACSSCNNKKKAKTLLAFRGVN